MKLKTFIAFGVMAALFLTPAVTLIWNGLTDRIEPADAALVLGNQVYSDGTPSPRLAGRLDRAAALYQAGYFPRIIVSGGTGKEGVPEGTAMKAYLVQRGTPADAIVVDNEGVNTYASAKFTANYLRTHGLKSAMVITQFFHIPRTQLALSKFGVSPIYHAHADYFEVNDFYSTLREFPAYLKYWLLPQANVFPAK